MPIHDIYSKRNKEVTDVFSYDSLPEKLKTQIGYIWSRFFKQIHENQSEHIWASIEAIIREEHGKKQLFAYSNLQGEKYFNMYKVQQYFEKLPSIDEALDVLELTFRHIENVPTFLKQNFFIEFYGTYSPELAIKDLNTRFLENGVGYEYESGKIIRVDNKLLHQEILKKTLHFLSSKTFQNANEEFLNAHNHFRNKRQKECLADCLKSLETTMKIICNLNSWAFNKTDTAKPLFDILFKNKLIPDYLNSHYSSLRTAIESGVPTLRNKLGGHGQGPDKIVVPDHFASFMLYMTGSTINFLISCQKDLKDFE